LNATKKDEYLTRGDVQGKEQEKMGKPLQKQGTLHSATETRLRERKFPRGEKGQRKEKGEIKKKWRALQAGVCKMKVRARDRW